jgi:hypothetical protein
LTQFGGDKLLVLSLVQIEFMAARPFCA